jgi:ferric-dicitrate binding protein FerR (iron transport regulator)
MNKDYTQFTTNDFIADEYFLQWARFPDADSDTFWKAWIEAHPEKKETVQAALQFIHALRFQTQEPTSQQIEQSLLKSLSAIAVKETDNQGSIRITPRMGSKPWRYWTAAAAAIMIVLFTWVYFHKWPVTMQLVTGDNEIKTIVLPDGSMLTLNANSSITYDTDMAKALRREVWLKGEAYFDVKHIEPEKEQPRRFVVHSGALNVEVLGTSFNVKNRASVTNVTLNTGSIRIDLKDAPGTPIFLQPGDFVQYSGKEKKVLRKKVKTELYSVWKDSMIVLKKMPLKDVAQMIEDAYGYKIRITDTTIANNNISGSLRLNDEAAALKALSEALDIDIIRQGQVLIIQPKNKTNAN